MRVETNGTMVGMSTRNLRNAFSETHWLFALVALIFGLILVLIIPPLWGLDEPSHFERVYQIAHGDIFPDRGGKKNYGGVAPANLVDLGNYAIGDLVDNNTGATLGRKDIDNVGGYKQFTSAKFSKVQKHTVSSASYSPVAYVGSIVGTILADSVNASIGHTLFMARLFSLMVYVLIGWISLRILRPSKLKWLFMILLLTPTSLFEASTVTADGTLISLSVLLLALFFRLVLRQDEQNRKKLLYGLIATAIALPLIKINYIFLSALLLFVPNNIFSKKRLTIYVKFLSIAIVVALAYLWSSIVKITANTPFNQRPDRLPVSASDQIAFMLHHPVHFFVAVIHSVIAFGDSYINSTTSLIGWNYIMAPLFFIILIYIALLISGLYAKNELEKIRSEYIPIIFLSMVGVLSIFAAMYVVFSPVGYPVIDGVQGRYFIPFLIPVIMVISRLTPFEIRIKEKVAPFIFTSLSIACILASVAMYYMETY